MTPSDALPSLTITPAAAKAFEEAGLDEGEHLHLDVSATFQFSLDIGPREASEIAVEAGGLTILLKPASAARADGVVIDFVEGPSGAGFSVTSPHEPPRVKQIAATELAAMLPAEGKFELFDVRTEHERAIATIPGSRILDSEAHEHIETLDRGTTLIFTCHHGGRSQAAAEHFVAKGFRDVYNVRGGIDAWSLTVDAKVARY